MKTITILSFLLVFCFVKASAQQISTAEMQVNGLTCSMCSQATEKSLRTLDFISTVKPDLNRNLFIITFKKDRPVNIDLLKTRVQDAGFSVGSLIAGITFQDLKVDGAGQAIVGNNIYRFANIKNKTLNGSMKVTVIDKQFLPAAAFKKMAAQINSDAYSSGTGTVNGKRSRIYHLSIS